jgi:phospholipase/carboxylesterase
MHEGNKVIATGKPLGSAKRVMVMLHGRGASAESILSLKGYLNNTDFAFVGPEASGNTWYPYSFMAPIAQNEPYLSSALLVISGLIEQLKEEHGFEQKDIYLLGFSQGACLALEYIVRNPAHYGGVFGLSGGLIGPVGTSWPEQGSLMGTPVFLGCSDNDLHIPQERVKETATVLEKLGAKVTMKLYTDFGHSINDDEIDRINDILTEEP